MQIRSLILKNVESIRGFIIDQFWIWDYYSWSSKVKIKKREYLFKPAFALHVFKNQLLSN